MCMSRHISMILLLTIVSPLAGDRCQGNVSQRKQTQKGTMDWAEELKMTIRKTTARKGRRSKSRDVLKEEQQQSTSQMSNSSSKDKDISIDITLDIQAHDTTTSSSRSPASTPSTYNNEFDSKRPPMRRISGGWADSGLKGLRSKKNSFDDERFQQTRSATSSIPTDDIPVIPDLDDVKDEIMLNEIVEPTSVSVNRSVTLKELSSDLLSQNAFSAIEDVDLSILTRCLQPQESLDEADDLWEWDKLFTEVTAQINSDKIPNMGVLQKIEIGPDEVPPTAQYT